MDRPCPTPVELSDFLLGKLDPEAAEEIAAHAGQCPRCQETVPALSLEGDTLVESLRQPVQAPFEEEPALQDALHLIAAIGRTMAPQDAISPPAGSSELPRQTLREYQLLEKLGEGGMGAVYKARHTMLDKIVAVKVLPRERMQDPAAVGRFLREMRAVGKLDHPNIVRAMDAGEVQGTHFLVMEFVEGIDLAQLVHRRGPLGVAEACELVRQAAIGLEEAREHGMVHRDIKPSNLMLCAASGRRKPPVVKILDLGLALLSDALSPDAKGLTTAGQVMGTLDYMAPEQGGDSHVVDIRADIYSLGATLYKLLTGQAIFEGQRYQTPVQKLMALANQPAPPIDRRRAGIPAELAAVVHRMLEKSPDQRFATPQQVAEALAPFAAGADLERLLSTEYSVPRMDPSHVASTSHAATEPHLSRSEVSTAPSLGAGLTTPSPAPASADIPSRPTSPLWIGLGVAVLLLAGFLGVTVYRIQTDNGTLVVEIADETVEAKLKQNGLVIQDTTSGRTFQINAAGTQRERSGDYKLADNQGLKLTVIDDAGLEVDTNEFKLTRGGNVRVRVTLQAVEQVASRPGAIASTALAPPAQPADRERPFVVHRKGGSQDEYQTLAAALALLRDGDTIEVHGNGPFTLGQITIAGKSLVLRGTPGYRPVFRAAEGVPPAWFVMKKQGSAAGSLEVEGCDFHHLAGGIGGEPEGIFQGEAVSWKFRNCRFLGDLYVLRPHGRTEITIEDCLVRSRAGGLLQLAAPYVWSHWAGKILVRNCIIQVASCFSFYSISWDSSIELQGNTIRCGELFAIRANVVKAPARPLEITASENLFECVFLLLRPAVETAETPKDMFRWQGRDNLFVTGRLHTALGWGSGPHLTSYPEWAKYWGDESSSAVRVWWRWDALSRGGAEELIAWLQADQQRLRREHKMPNVGPDWSLVGPGEAYVRARFPNVPADQLRPPAPKEGPFVILRQEKLLRGYPGLVEALKDIQDGDVLEIRSDEPFQGRPDANKHLKGKRTFTLRAAPGYRPVQVGMTKFHPVDSSVTLEGIQTYTSGRNWDFALPGVRRIVNCSFEADDSLPAEASPFDLDLSSLEIENSVVPVSLGLKVLVKNSLICGGNPRGSKKGHTYEWQLDRCHVWYPAVVSLWGPPERYKLHIHDSILDVFALLNRKYTGSLDCGGNVYRLGLRQWDLGEPQIATLADWQKATQTDADSVRVDPLHYDPAWWRLLPGSPGYQARANGKDLGADVTRIATSVRSDALPPAAERSSPTPAPPAQQADREKPFVVHRKGGSQDEYQTLAAALAVLREGDSVEVFGNGPFTLGQITISGKSLRLRAAPGYRPVFRAAESVPPAWFVMKPQGTAVDSLEIEGCDFHHLAGGIGSVSNGIFQGVASSWKFRNCRFLGDLSVLAAHGRIDLTMEDCLVASRAGGVWQWLGREDAKVAVRNCILQVASCFAFNDISADCSIELSGNTIRCEDLFVLGQNKAKAPARPLEIIAAENVFDCLFFMRCTGPDLPSAAKDMFRWQGQDNLFVTGRLSTAMIWGSGPHLTTYPEWAKYWGDESSSAARVWWRPDALSRSGAKELTSWLQADQLRLRGQHKLPNVGPDWSLVGPGEAYVRAQFPNVPADQIRPPAPKEGPFVILRAEKLLRGYPDLLEALKAIQDGDILEIRSDDPFQGNIDASGHLKGKRSFTVRAAPGYRPVQIGLTRFHDVDSSIALEGIEIRTSGSTWDLTLKGVRRIVNCSFEGDDSLPPDGANVDLGSMEIVNSVVPVSMGPSVVARNSLVGGPNGRGSGRGLIYEWRLDRCHVWFPAIARWAPPSHYKWHIHDSVLDVYALLTPHTGSLDGSGNIYRLGLRHWDLLKPQIATLADWQQATQTDADSVRVDPLHYDPAWWRLLPGSPGYQAGAEGKDLGADVTRIAR